jgi:CheY-like chemotaxis protein
MRKVRWLHRPLYAWILTLAFYDAFHGNIVLLDAAGHGTLVNEAGSGPMTLADRAYFQQAIDPKTSDRLVVGTPVPANLVPIIALTANAFAEDAAACRAAGMNDFVPKPLDFDLLAHAFDRWAQPLPAEIG